MKRIGIITSKYPNKFEPNILVFVKQLAWEFADQGIDVSIIVPLPININIKYIKIPKYREEYTTKGNLVKVYSPRYIGFGQKDILFFNPARLTTYLFKNSIISLIKEKKLDFDALYGHFITPAGISAAQIGEKLNTPSFFAYGESSPWTIKHYGVKKATKALRNINGIVAVSTHNKAILENLLGINPALIRVLPNGVDLSKFFNRKKQESRNKFNLPLNAFIVSFVGSFDDRKGIKRLEEAVDGIEDVYFIAAGSGKLKPQSSKCLFYGQVSHEDLPFFYSASDVFVLPTLNEGSCNAIIEAIACGVPVISSERSYNDDILSDSFSLRINPESINQIKDSIIYAKNNMNRFDDFTKNTNNYSHQFDISARAKKIINFIDERTNAYENKS